MKPKHFLISFLVLLGFATNVHANGAASEGWTVVDYSDTAEGDGDPSYIIDGDFSTFWHNDWKNSIPYPHNITLMHEGEITLDKIQFFFRGGDYYPSNMIVYISNDNENWTTVDQFAFERRSGQTIQFDNPITTIYIKFEFTTGYRPYLAINEIIFNPSYPEGNIIFADSAVKEICVANWDSNNDGELSYEEATEVTSISEFQDNKSISSFDEFQYFIHVSSVYRSFEGCSNLTSITLPDDFQSIDWRAFFGCSSLASIIIPSGVTSIGERAFDGCSNLTSTTISGEGLVSIGNHAFEGCTSLTSISIPSSVESIGSYAFNACTNLTSISIPSSVTSIESNAFGNHNMIVTFASTTPCTQNGLGTNVKLAVPSSAVSTYRETWSDLANEIVDAEHLEKDVNVTANESESAVVAAIGEDFLRSVLKLKVSGTFNGYDLMVFRNKMINLMELDLSDANVVGNSYRYYESNYSKDNTITGKFVSGTVEKLKLPKDITALDAYAFYGCSRLKDIELPEGITTIPEYSFYNCRSLTTITIPESVTSIGYDAFTGCYNLSSIVIPDEVTVIEYDAFINCRSLNSISLPKGLHSLGGWAFCGCSQLSEIHLPPYLTEIGDNVFSECNNLKTIYAYMPDIISIGTNTFNDYTHQQLYVPEFLYKNYFYDTNWSQFSSVNTRSLSPDDYDKVPTNSDIVFGEDEERIPDNSDGTHVDGDINTEGSFTVEGDEPQPFDNVDQNLNGEGQGGSLIGEDDGEHEGNLTVNHLRVKINVKAGRWYFFCFPYDVIVAECEYPAQYAWRWYDGLARANGEGGWKPVTSETLTAGQGYAFQTSHTGNLIITFDHPTFGGDRPKPLQAYASGNQANASWNFVGNPYSSFYDFMVNDFSSPITVYNVNGTYSAYRPGDDEIHLQPYEAFFVQKPTEVSSILFDADRRETYRKSEEKKANRIAARRAKGIDPQRRLINLEILSGEELMDKTRVVLNDVKSHAYELDCDAAKMMSGDAKAQLYSVENGVNMAINERPQAGDIRLGYTAKVAGTLSISASRMDMPMMLVDTQLGTTFDLSLGSYDFDTAAGTFDGRFLLRPSGEATAINQLTAKTGVCIGTQDGGIAIGGAEGKIVNVFTVGGAQAAQHSGNGYIALKSGVYVVSVDGVSAKVRVR